MFWYLKIWKRRLATLKATNWLWYKGKKRGTQKVAKWTVKRQSSIVLLFSTLQVCPREGTQSARVSVRVWWSSYPAQDKATTSWNETRKKKDGDNNKKKKEERTHPLVNASNLKGKEEAAWQRTTDLQRHKRPATRLPRQLCAARQHLHVLK